jgi:hypothetical protein
MGLPDAGTLRESWREARPTGLAAPDAATILIRRTTVPHSACAGRLILTIGDDASGVRGAGR